MIKVGLTEIHGISDEAIKFPPKGVKYSHINCLIDSSISGNLRSYSSDMHDILESTIFPIITKNRWIYTPANFQAAASFDIFGYYHSRTIRVGLIKRLMLKENFKKLIFKSRTGRNTLSTYGKIKDKALLSKTEVVYPAVRKIDDSILKKKDKDNINFLFPGPNFLRKGGVNVVDAFERLQKRFDNISLTITGHFPDTNETIKKIYSRKVSSNPNINMLYVSREKMFKEIYPKADIFVLPTYFDTYGYSIEEAMAFGLPVISTDFFAIPEIVEKDRNALLINTKRFDFINKNRDYNTRTIPKEFRRYMTDKVYGCMSRLICDDKLRRSMGRRSLMIARTKFSFDKRNKIMKRIYEEAMC